MNPLPDLPDLRVLPTEGLQPHEHSDESRAAPLAEALSREGVLKNPPIVMPLEPEAKRFVVLDGANRTAAFKQLGIPAIVAQVVTPGIQALQVQNWNHVVLDGDTEGMLGRLRAGDGFELVPSDPEGAPARLEGLHSLAYLVLPDASVLEVPASGASLAERVRGLNSLVDAYAGECRMERTNAASIEGMGRVYGAFACLVVFPRFEVSEIVEATASGMLFPGGVTRFIISPRALRINYPLDSLSDDRPLEEKSAELEAFVRERVRQRRARYYAESTFLFDE